MRLTEQEHKDILDELQHLDDLVSNGMFNVEIDERIHFLTTRLEAHSQIELPGDDEEHDLNEPDDLPPFKNPFDNEDEEDDLPF